MLFGCLSCSWSFALLCSLNPGVRVLAMWSVLMYMFRELRVLFVCCYPHGETAVWQLNLWLAVLGVNLPVNWVVVIVSWVCCRYSHGECQRTATQPRLSRRVEFGEYNSYLTLYYKPQISSKNKFHFFCLKSS